MMMRETRNDPTRSRDQLDAHLSCVISSTDPLLLSSTDKKHVSDTG